MSVPILTLQQTKDLVFQMDKWGNNLLKDAAAEVQTLHCALWEREELNEIYYQIWGTYNSVDCCIAGWMKTLADWYFEHKNKLNA